MRNGTITFGLLCLTIILFVSYFSINSIIFSSRQPIVNQLNNIILYSQQNKWEKAEEATDKLLESWKKLKYFLAINYAEADFSLFLDNLARIQGGVKTKDITETVTQSQSTLKLWENFTRVIPEP